MFLSFLNNSWCRIHDWNTLKIVFFKNWLCMCICIWVCTCECRCLQRPEIAKNLELEWKENHELPNMNGWYVLNTKFRSSGWSANTATYQIILQTMQHQLWSWLLVRGQIQIDHFILSKIILFIAFLAIYLSLVFGCFSAINSVVYLFYSSFNLLELSQFRIQAFRLVVSDTLCSFQLLHILPSFYSLLLKRQRT